MEKKEVVGDEDSIPVTVAGTDRPAEQDGPKYGIRNLSLAVLAVSAVILMLHHLQEVFVPIVLAVLISYALEPLVRWSAKLLKSRALSAALILLALLAGFGYGLYSLRGQAADFVDSLPEAAQSIRQKLRANAGNGGALEKVKEAAAEIERTAAAAQGSKVVPVAAPAFSVREYLWWGSKGILTFSGQVFIILFLAYFILATGDLYRRKIVKIAGPGFSEKRLTVQIIQEIDSQIERFLLVQVLASLTVAVLTGLGLHWLGIRNAAIWGILAGLLNPIPYLGPIVVASGVGVIAFLQTTSFLMAAYATGITILITGIEGMLLAPILMGRAASINQAAVFVGLLFWGWIWGAWGAILAVPMLVVIKSICERIEGLQPVSEFLSDK